MGLSFALKADSQLILFVCFSKSIVDGMNGNSKHKLTVAAGRKYHPSLDPDLSRTFAPLTKVEGKAFSPAEECKRFLELDAGTTTGAKSVVKHEKQESNRKVRNYHYWVRGADETLSSLKYESPDKFTKEKYGVMSMYHIHSCFEMDLQWIGFRRIPCNCLSCRQQMRQPWQNGIGFKQQPKFQLEKNCKYRNYLSDKICDTFSSWNIVGQKTMGIISFSWVKKPIF